MIKHMLKNSIGLWSMALWRYVCDFLIDVPTPTPPTHTFSATPLFLWALNVEKLHFSSHSAELAYNWQSTFIILNYKEQHCIEVHCVLHCTVWPTVFLVQNMKNRQVVIS